AGIAVNMDVVYNHTNGTGAGSLYDMTVPQYFYRMNGAAYSNGSGCGNEVATNHAMVKYYVVESLKHWMEDYHINGFRFDLMGLHEQSTMKEIYEELYKIDPKVMVYGEPWTGGTAAVVNGMTGAVTTADGYGVGAFDDDFRDAIKGGEFGGFKIAQVQENYNDAGIEAGLLGKSGGNNRNNTGKPGLALHYVECHDNYTLYDKLAYSANVAAGVEGIIGGDAIVPKFLLNPTAAQLETIRKQDKLSAAYVFLAQGTPFINGGQEFLRTKKGNPDSYSADTKGGVTWTNTPGQYNIDDCNTIDLGFKTTYSDVYNTYKALIKIRKDYDAFTKGSYVTAANVGVKGVTKYETDGSDGKTYQVYFNATSADCTLPKAVEGYKFTISEADGTYSVASASAAISVIPAKGFVILQKK
ncbi:MAG: alpha-amylase, partial [Treponemataceae bacterium]|nr:alpha-amylase [Treponemataceae bacterium]